MVNTKGKEPVVWHNGTNGLNYAVVWLLPERHVAIVATTNIGLEIQSETERSVTRTESAMIEAYKRTLSLIKRSSGG